MKHSDELKRPEATWHIQAGAEVVKEQLAGGEAEWPHCKYPNRTSTNVVPLERRGELIEMGFTDFKRQGRNRRAHKLASYLVEGILSDEGREALKDTLRPVFFDATCLVLMGASADVLTSIPEA